MCCSAVQYSLLSIEIIAHCVSLNPEERGTSVEVAFSECPPISDEVSDD
jgi:hypothetical protein